MEEKSIFKSLSELQTHGGVTGLSNNTLGIPDTLFRGVAGGYSGASEYIRMYGLPSSPLPPPTPACEHIHARARRSSYFDLNMYLQVRIALALAQSPQRCDPPQQQLASLEKKCKGKYKCGSMNTVVLRVRQSENLCRLLGLKSSYESLQLLLRRSCCNFCIDHFKHT